MKRTLLVHIVTYHSSAYIAECLGALLDSKGGHFLEIKIVVTDNSPADSVAEIVAEYPEVTFYQQPENLGFCGGHNSGVNLFLEGDYEFLLILNPDVAIDAAALEALAHELCTHPTAGTATPLLLRANSDLTPLDPPVIDAAGMELTSALRHFDRGSDSLLTDRYKESENVFGGTGACLLLKRECVEALILPHNQFQSELYRVYPQLEHGANTRKQLFDEAFFAYREDADLAWRAQSFGWDCIFVPSAIGYHIRKVTADRRSATSDKINLLGVKNRFLLQLNNYTLDSGLATLFHGFLLRNFLVLLGVLLFERTSLAALSQLWILRKRAWANRKIIAQHRKRSVKSWIR